MSVIRRGSTFLYAAAASASAQHSALVQGGVGGRFKSWFRDSWRTQRKTELTEAAGGGAGRRGGGDASGGYKSAAAFAGLAAIAAAGNKAVWAMGTRRMGLLVLGVPIAVSYPPVRT